MQQLKRLTITLMFLTLLIFIPYNLAVYFTDDTIFCKNYFINYLCLSFLGIMCLFGLLMITMLLINLSKSIVNYIKTGKL